MAHEKVYFSKRNYERRSSKLAGENAKMLSCILKKLHVFTCLCDFHPLAARLRKLAIASKTAPTCSIPSTGASFQPITRRASYDTEFAHFTKMTGTVVTKHVLNPLLRQLKL